MLIARTVEEARAAVRDLKKSCFTEGKNGSVGYVPTMGYLHEGHASLLKRARSENDLSVLSIFVNPLQFGPTEDFSRYPRDEERDLLLAKEHGVDLVFMPDIAAMYPKPIQTKVSVSGTTELLCGASRPGHFDGVSTVVMKLFHILQPDRAYFGMKDAQQVAVIDQMTEDLNLPITIVPCPIVREPDGLALSSRNVYLSDEERRQALVLSQTLQLTSGWLKEYGSDYQAVKKKMRDHIQTAPLADIDYVELMEYPSIQPVVQNVRSDSRILAALAVRFGRTRLIDNRLFQVENI